MQVLYEDNHILAVNKRAGEIVQADKTRDIPPSGMVADYLREKYSKPGNVFVGVVHRLDRPVSGVVLFARTSKALVRLNETFRSRENIRKTYWAIVYGRPREPEMLLEHWIQKNERQNKSYVVRPDAKGAQQARLYYRTMVCGLNYTLLEVTLLTGRHHQIRCQLAAIGCPIRGDLKYGARRSNPDAGISLHARQISFVHPVSKENITIVAPVPDNDSLWQSLAGQMIGEQNL
ncbi:MAG: RluA family pseudouridine synthase [Paludibacteraceae bacterium]|nr:RluA family pseudouridine synthase [Paludibacteraceae bacterium]